MTRRRTIEIAKEIPLTQGKVAIVDDEDYEWLSLYKWQYRGCSKTGYAVRTVPPDRKAVFMHREICNPGEGRFVDHVNGNGLDNRRDNLRSATRADNCRNIEAPSTNSSGYKGVSFDKQVGKWKAVISVNDRKITIGRYLNKTDAARAYNAKATELFGEFARLNQIPEEAV